MLCRWIVGLAAALALLSGEAAAQRIIEYNGDYLPRLPDNLVRLAGAATIVMSEADANLVVVEPEAHMPWTMRQHRIQMPIGAIVRNTAFATYGEVFGGGVSASTDATGLAAGAVAIQISEIAPGYDYRQPDERRPAAPGEFFPPSTPSAELRMRIQFFDADGQELYDNFHPPFAQPPAEECAQGDLCVGTRITTLRRLGPVQTGMGNSKELINRALHEVTRGYLLRAICEFEADTRARALGARVNETDALLCRYPGYELVSAPAGSTPPTPR